MNKVLKDVQRHDTRASRRIEMGHKGYHEFIVEIDVNGERKYTQDKLGEEVRGG